jgi:HSP20 family protein
MSMLKWKDFDEMSSMKDEVDRLFDKMFENTTFHSWEERYALTSSSGVTPEFSISQRDEGIVIQASLPGFEKGDVKVSVSGNLLAIGSEVSREREFRGNDAYRYQRSHGSFCKVMELPAGTDVNNIKASFENGVLEVLLPKVKTGVTDGTNVPINTDLTLPTDSLPDEFDENM